MQVIVSTVVGWKWLSGFVSASNVVLLGVVSGTTEDLGTLPGLAALVGGVTIPFGVGWFWNRQYLAAKERHNEYLLARVTKLTEDLTAIYTEHAAERSEKLRAQEEADTLRLAIARLREEIEDLRHKHNEGPFDES